MYGSWWDMVSPQQGEMEELLRKYIGSDWWRTPKNKWEGMWRTKHGIVLPARQRGFFRAPGLWTPPAGGTNPTLSDVTDEESRVAPDAARETLAYDSDGSLRWWAGTGAASFIAYADLTTQTDDANDHTSEWWPDQPDVNEGLNWDIRYTNDVSTGTVSNRHYFKDGSAVDRTVDTWYLLDTVSNDHADGTHNGAIGVARLNGTAKSPDTGTGNIIVDVEIRTTGSGSAVASHTVSLTVTGT